MTSRNPNLVGDKMTLVLPSLSKALLEIFFVFVFNKLPHNLF